MHYTKITVQKGIPIPETKPRGKAGNGREGKYPWRRMEIGDSFLFPVASGCRAHSAAAQAGWRTGMRFLVAPCGEYFRIWRVE